MRPRAFSFAGSASLTLAIAVATACGSSGPVALPSSGGPDASVEAGAEGGNDAQRDAGPAPLESEPPPVIADDVRLDANSSPVIFDALRGRVWTANGDVGSISYVDIDTPKLLAEIPIGSDIRSVALSPDKKWIAAVDRAGASVTLVDGDSQKIARTIALGTHPRAAVWDAWNPRWLYVSLEDDGAVAVIDRTLGVLVQTIPVGRLPAGLAVSRLRHELYVTHRIDGMISRVSLDADQLATNVMLANEPNDADPTVPQGKPFSLESAALTADGNILWIPHELFAPTHPFQFQQTVFPTVSLVDFGNPPETVITPYVGGQEVVDNAGDLASGIIDGRKNLFDAITIADSTGATEVLSQPCAVAMHPNGNVAYVIACGSEDLLTFDLTQGIAVAMLRNLPGDHPVGIALDDTGQRAFVVSDQSHTLIRFDLANGDLTQNVTVLGSTIPLVAKDPVDPDLRAGLTLFYRANSSKGTLPTTGNNWMSCNACHLDGFVSTNAFLFEGAHVVDPTADARIGHIGLADLFSTSPTPTSPTFNPHDVLVAFTDMGGIAPDRTGASRVGAVDPSMPTADAATMAAQVARVIARDLPVGPTWLLPGAMPNESYDGAWCGNCHQAEYAAWKKSAHAHSAQDPMVLYGVGVEQKLQGPQYSRLCAGCHDPVSVRLGDTTLASGRSITCLGCHDVSRRIQAGGNGDLESTAQDWTVDHKAKASAELATLRTPQFCGGCHQQFVPGTGLLAIGTLDEWNAGPYAASNPPTACVDCHMPKVNGVADHQAIGGNVYMGTQFADAPFVAALKGNLSSAVQLTATLNSGSVTVQVENVGSGHGFPTGVTDIREPWVELQAMDASGNVLARYGGPDASGLIPSTAARLGIDIASADGTVLLLHQLSETTRIPYDQRVASHGVLDFTITPGSPAPAGMTELDAVLFYRNVRTPYYRAATMNPTATLPDLEVARVKVQ